MEHRAKQRPLRKVEWDDGGPGRSRARTWIGAVPERRGGNGKRREEFPRDINALLSEFDVGELEVADVAIYVSTQTRYVSWVTRGCGRTD